MKDKPTVTIWLGNHVWLIPLVFGGITFTALSLKSFPLLILGLLPGLLSVLDDIINDIKNFIKD